MPSSCHFLWVKRSTSVLGLELIFRDFHAQRNRGAEDGDLPLITSHDGRLAAGVERADQAGAVDDGDVRVVAFVLGPAGDVDHLAVAVVSQYGELLAILAGDDSLLGKHADLGDLRIGRAAEGRAAGDPAADELIFVGADFEAFAARVGHGAGRLLQQQAKFGSGREQAPATVFLDECLIIELGNEAQERQAKAILPARFAVAAAAVATELGEDRHDMVAEIDGQILAHRLRRDGDRDHLVAVICGDRRRAVGQRNNPARAGDTQDGFVALLCRLRRRSDLAYRPANTPVITNCRESSPPTR